MTATGQIQGDFILGISIKICREVPNLVEIGQKHGQFI
jgi:hypothetical protein